MSDEHAGDWATGLRLMALAGAGFVAMVYPNPVGRCLAVILAGAILGVTVWQIRQLRRQTRSDLAARLARAKQLLVADGGVHAVHALHELEWIAAHSLNDEHHHVRDIVHDYLRTVQPADTPRSVGMVDDAVTVAQDVLARMS